MNTSWTDGDLRATPTEELLAAVVHLEDLEIFVGQRSRLHPGPGWATALAMVRRDLAAVQAEVGSRDGGVPCGVGPHP